MASCCLCICVVWAGTYVNRAVRLKICIKLYQSCVELRTGDSDLVRASFKFQEEHTILFVPSITNGIENLDMR